VVQASSDVVPRLGYHSPGEVLMLKFQVVPLYGKSLMEGLEGAKVIGGIGDRIGFKPGS